MQGTVSLWHTLVSIRRVLSYLLDFGYISDASVLGANMCCTARCCYHSLSWVSLHSFVLCFVFALGDARYTTGFISIRRQVIKPSVVRIAHGISSRSYQRDGEVTDATPSCRVYE